MPIDHDAFEHLISLASTPKPCVTRVTCVTTNDFSGLGGHSGCDRRVTCVTGIRSSAVRHASSDRIAPKLVTGNHQQNHDVVGAGHAVTRSRTRKQEQENCRTEAFEGVLITPADWLAARDERAAILEFDGGYERLTAERLALDETVAALGPKPECVA